MLLPVMQRKIGSFLSCMVLRSQALGTSISLINKGHWALCAS
jgi:hypothetical protein